MYALRCLPVGNHDDCNKEEKRADVNIVSKVRKLSCLLNPVKPKLIAQQTA